MITCKAPGKLFIAGEYAVVTPGEPAVVVAIDRFVTVTVAATSEENALAAAANYSPHVLAAAAVVQQLCAEKNTSLQPYTLRVESELDASDGRKFGLGSSGAVTVASIDALTKFCGVRLSQRQLFQLALLATISISQAASGGDIAASVYGGWLSYSAPDRAALHAFSTRHGVSETLARGPWQGFSVTELPTPVALELLVGWTGSPIATDFLVDSVQSGLLHNESWQQSFLARSREYVNQLSAALQRGGEGAAAPIHQLRKLLGQLAAASGTEIETAKLSTLCNIAEQHGAAAKTSGAGGGDCGIVLAGRECDTSLIIKAWQAHDILPLPLNVYRPAPRMEI